MNTKSTGTNTRIESAEDQPCGIISDAQIKKLWRATQRAYGIKDSWYKRLWWWLLDKLG